MAKSVVQYSVTIRGHEEIWAWKVMAGIPSIGALRVAYGSEPTFERAAERAAEAVLEHQTNPEGR